MADYSWQPMDAAPRDGTWILLRLPVAMIEEPAVFVAQWVTFEGDPDPGEWSEYHSYNLEAEPEAWAPLPEGS